MSKNAYLINAKKCADAIDEAILATAQEKCKNGIKCNAIEKRHLSMNVQRMTDLAMASWAEKKGTRNV